MADQEKKIFVDEDWKSQVEKERAELDAKPSERTEGDDPHEIPPASFQMLVTSIGSQAMMSLGQIPDPVSGQGIYHPELARHHIDTLVVLQEKTVGNLSLEEKEMLETFIVQLRQVFVQMGTAMRDAMAKQALKNAPIDPRIVT